MSVRTLKEAIKRCEAMGEKAEPEILTEQKNTVFYENHDMINNNYNHESCHEKPAQNVIHWNEERLKGLLDSWQVYYPEKELAKYGKSTVEEAVKRTISKKPRIPGAFYKTVIRNLVC